MRSLLDISFNNVEGNENNTFFTSFREFITFGVTDMKFVQYI